MTPHPEKRLITIDAETVERIRACVDRRRPLATRWQCGVDAAWSILAAWEEGAERRDAQREHYPTDKCPDPDCAYAQEVASLHVQVSRLESRLDSTRGELERTRERLREAERERDEWKRDAQHLERSCRRLSRRLTALREAVEEIVERWDDAEAREHPAATHRRLRHALDSLDERGGRDG